MERGAKPYAILCGKKTTKAYVCIAARGCLVAPERSWRRIGSLCGTRRSLREQCFQFEFGERSARGWFLHCASERRNERGMGPRLALACSPRGEGEQAFRFTGLSQIEGGIRLGVDRKFGLGWKAPRLQIDFYTACRGPQRATRDPVHAALARRACGRRSLGRCRGRRPSIHPRTPARQSPRQRMIEQNTHFTRCY